MTLRPLNDHVIVEPMEKEAMTKGGIVLPDTADKEKPEKGKVLAIGPGKMLDDGRRAVMSVKPGDSIVFKKYSPDEVKIDEKEYLVLSESDIIAVVE